MKKKFGKYREERSLSYFAQQIRVSKLTLQPKYLYKNGKGLYKIIISNEAYKHIDVLCMIICQSFLIQLVTMRHYYKRII